MTTSADTETFSVSRWSRTAGAASVTGAVVLVALAAVPYYAGSAAEQPLVTLFLFVALAALWNLMAGFAGLTSFGQQAYLGIGAYALYLITSHGVDPFLAIPVAAVAAAVVALPVSFLVLRLSGGHFAVATWVVAEVFRIVVTLSPAVGGNTGAPLRGATSHSPLVRQALTYWWALAVMVGSVAGIYLLVRGRYGLDARAVRSEPVAAASSGVSVGRTRRLAYCLAAFGTGMAGAVVFAHTLYVQPGSIFGVQYSVYLMFMVVIGGIGTIEGPILGALVFFGLQQTLAGYGAWYLVLLGLTAMLVTLFAPRGLWGFAAHRWGWSLFPVGYRVRPEAR